MENQEIPLGEFKPGTSKALLMNSLSIGLIVAGIFIILSVLYYILDISIKLPFTTMLLFLVDTAIMITATIIVMKKFRDKINGGTTTFSKSLFSGWIMGVIGLGIFGAFFFLFCRYFDPKYMPDQFERLLDWMREKNVPDEKIEETAMKIKEGSHALKQIGSTAMAYIISSGVLSLIVAAFIRKKEKMPETL